MRIETSRPPNWEEVTARFEVPRGAVFTFGDTIHNPDGGLCPPDLLVHEQVHREQQAKAGGPEAWWARYLRDDAWRLQQELEAYRKQFAWVSPRVSVRMRVQFLASIAADLASPMYGLGLTLEKAAALIRNR